MKKRKLTESSDFIQQSSPGAQVIGQRTKARKIIFQPSRINRVATRIHQRTIDFMRQTGTIGAIDTPFQFVPRERHFAHR
jgi:hypothetical protein